MSEMKWQLQFSPEFKEDAQKLPVALRRVVAEQVRRLEANPKKLGKPGACPPHLPGYQIYEFDHLLDGDHHHFIVFFKYREEVIQVHLLGHVLYARPT